jgi:hypothetical protein
MTNKKGPLVQICIREGCDSNLVANRWRGRRLTRQEEAELVRQAKSDERAATTLLLRSHGYVLACVGKYKIPPPRRTIINNQKVWLIDDRFGDLVATGMLEVLEALRLFDPERGWRFNTSTRLPVAGEIADEHKRLLRRGIVGETRADRYAHNHPGATDEQVANKVQCSLLRANEAIDRLKAFKWLGDYSTTETFDEEGGKYSGPDIPDSHSVGQHFDCYRSRQLSPHLRHFEGVSRTIDDAARTRLADMRRLAKIGRQQYALELAAKDRALAATVRARQSFWDCRIEGIRAELGTLRWHTPTLFQITSEYSISINTAATAEPPSERTYELRCGKWKNLPQMEVQKQASTVWDERTEWSPLWRTLTPRAARFRWDQPNNEHRSGDNPSRRISSLKKGTDDAERRTPSRARSDLHHIDRSHGRDHGSPRRDGGQPHSHGDAPGASSRNRQSGPNAT